ncbi:MAG TPA: SRPBCC domain-containing protein [Polyangiaceae bacterium]
MAFELRTEIDVEAPAARVWAVLSDFARYPEWNPFVMRIEGRLEVGSKLSVRLRLSGGRAVPIRPRVTTLIAGQAFAWRGELLSRALFVGEHRFEVIPGGDGRARFVHSERFNGVLVPLLEKTLNTKARAGFEAMNRALKRRAEALA